MDKTGKGRKKQKAELPIIKRQVAKFLTSEEAKISAKGLMSSAVVMVSLGIAAETSLAGLTHTSGHNNWPHNSHGNHSNGPCYQGHSSYSPHMSTSTHESQALNHTNALAKHSNTAAHSDAALGVPHTSAHTNAALSEQVTLGALHNDATAGYGKHSAGTGHHNVPIASRFLNAAGGGHASTTPHANDADSVPAWTALHHGSVAPHTSAAYTHINRSPSVCNSHGSHSSHGQW